MFTLKKGSKNYQNTLKRILQTKQEKKEKKEDICLPQFSLLGEKYKSGDKT